MVDGGVEDGLGYDVTLIVLVKEVREEDVKGYFERILRIVEW